MAKQIEPYEMTRLGILNPYGSIWTASTFDTREQAEQYISDFWRGTKHQFDLSKFKVIPVNVKVTALEQRDQT